ncbi:hypothetical protein [Epilithonimonas sp. UC225_85]|uniref:hypothetical protein n=1 Tax=Epilithonimonas sp. UC225_85 TaxID=3350167 RepID=UPI0036D2795A
MKKTAYHYLIISTMMLFTSIWSKAQDMSGIEKVYISDSDNVGSDKSSGTMYVMNGAEVIVKDNTYITGIIKKIDSDSAVIIKPKSISRHKISRVNKKIKEVLHRIVKAAQEVPTVVVSLPPLPSNDTQMQLICSYGGTVVAPTVLKQFYSSTIRVYKNDVKILDRSSSDFWCQHYEIRYDLVNFYNALFARPPTVAFLI